jgi:2-dehydropantoate 2-reductase
MAEVEAAEEIDGLPEPDLVVLTVKAYQTRSAVDLLANATWPNACVVTLQNGLGNLEVLRQWKGAKAFGATTTMGASLVSPGEVRLSGLGRTVVGADMDEPGARRIAEAFSSCGLNVDVRRDIAGEIWAKAVVNCCINPLTAVLRVPNGKLLESPTVSRLMSEICLECSAAAIAAGVALPEGRMIDRVRAVAEDTASNRSSMLRDIELGRRTEIAQLNGAVCRVGSQHGIPTPLNRAMVAMVEALEPASP